MPLDPQVARLLEHLAQLKLPPMETLTPQQVRGARQELGGGGFPVAEIEVGSVENTTFPGPECNIPVRIYRPHADGPHPVLVFYHGGGWVLGNLDSHDSVCRAICQLADIAVVSVDYRLAPESKFPAAVWDAWAATKYVSAHAAELGFDANSLAVGGDSAGGNLAAVVTQLAKKEQAPAIAYQVLIYPSVEFRTEENARPSMLENAQGYFLTVNGMMWFRDHYLNSSEDMLNPLASPILTEDLRDLPPALLITAEYDPLRDDGAAYAERLQEAGVPVEYTNYPGMIHGFVSMAPVLDGGKKALQQIAECLKNAL